MPRRFALALAITLTTVAGASIYSLGGFGWQGGQADSSPRQIIQIVEATAQPALQGSAAATTAGSDTAQLSYDQVSSYLDAGSGDDDGSLEGREGYGDDDGSEFEDD
jgi:hypothetical protein